MGGFFVFHELATYFHYFIKIFYVDSNGYLKLTVKKNAFQF